MIFRRVHIDGFGIWHDLDLSELSPGLNVFLAPNEGGKSTLMAFIRAVLFGFKRRNDPRRYEPLRGGRHGGFLELEAGGELHRVTRAEGTSSRGDVEVTNGAGERFSEVKLDSLLCNTTETLYENVFAFGLEELQRLDTLQTDDVAGHIYAAGMGSGSLTPVAFRALLQDAMEALYRPKGKKQPVAKLMTEIEAEEEQIGKLRQRPAEHAELLRREQRTRERLTEYDAAFEQRRLECDAVQRAERAWPDYEKLLRAETTLDMIGVSTAQLGHSSRAQIDARAESGSTADRADGIARVAVQEANRELGVIGQVDAVELMASAQRALLVEANNIRRLVANADRLKELQTTVIEHQHDARALRHALFNDLEELGATWSLERVRGARTDVAARDAIRRWRERLRRAENDIDTSSTRAADANLVYEALQESREQISRGTLLVSWCLIVLAIVLTAVLVPAPARLASTASIVSVGGLLGTLITWLHTRGLRQRKSEHALAAEREAELWHQHEASKEELHKTRKQWREWLQEQHLAEDLSTQGALDLLDRIRQTQAKDLEASEAEGGVTSAKAELQHACMDVLTVFEEIDRPIEDLRYDALKMVDPLVSAIQSVHAELDDVERHRERIRSGLDDLAQAQAALTALAGDEGYLTFRRRLESWDPAGLARAVGEAKGRLASTKADRDAVNESLGALREQARTLEADEQLADLLVVRESRRSALAEAVMDWAAHAVAGALYDDAKHKYEAERQPEVLRLASRYLRLMTDGRYSRVIAPLGESRLVIELRDSGERLVPAALSRGTGEQLYLSMRLALAKVYGAEAVPLPLVADDILVNFDDDRARATAALLGTFASEGHQILAFTCHRHLVETFERNAPGASIRQLPAHS